MHAERILGIDPGLQVTGYGLLDCTAAKPKVVEAGIVRANPKAPLPERLLEIHSGIGEIIRAFQPTAVALEQLYSHYKRPQTAILMGHARGVICLAAAQAAIPVEHYAATQVKRILTGNGRAPKTQVQLAICRELNLPQIPEPHDVADALAIAICHVYLHARAETLKQ